MCGFSGFFCQSPHDIGSFSRHVNRMIDMLQHRGPDDRGTWVDAEAGIALGHRRLAILDLSPHGHQPMLSHSGRYIIAFNGEIYNYRALQAELEKTGFAYAWKGHSDTEVLLAALQHWGVEKALERLNGMFAFALWDRRERILHLARDRFGEKPLYYGWMRDVFLFGSELKALKAHPAWQAELDRWALTRFMQYSYVPAPYSIYQGIYKLLPGHILSLPLAGGCLRSTAPRAYWSLKQMAEDGVRHPFLGNEAEAIESLGTLLHNAVALRMEADVPLGAFLSGGIDSSTVVALMQAQSTRPVRTFSIGFHEKSLNEAKYAMAVARHLGTEHTELYVKPEEAIAVIPRLSEIYDEPFADASQIPTFLVSQMTRQHVTVALSGDGGDELFGGYHRHFWASDVWRVVETLPRQAKAVLAHCLTAIPPHRWDTVFSVARPILTRRLRGKSPGIKLHKLAGILACKSPEEMYCRLVSHWMPGSVVVGTTEPSTALTDAAYWLDGTDFTRQVMFLDLVSYLPDDILAKVDRASMAVSLEARVPLLDHRVADFAWRLPLAMKVRAGQGKWILRQVLYRYVPKALVERPKMGFEVPLDAWLRGPLRQWAEHLLDETRLKREGFFVPGPIRKRWAEHLSGDRNWGHHLWAVLMFEQWFEREST
jgi:asparagine synthase (glutamine-hydrolysing)